MIMKIVITYLHISFQALHIFIVYNTFILVIFASLASPATLFRRNCLGTKCFDQFMKVRILYMSLNVLTITINYNCVVND